MKRVGNTVLNVIEYTVWYFNVFLFFMLALHVVQDYFFLTKEENWHKVGVNLGKALNLSSNITEDWFKKYFGRYLTIDYIPHRIHIICTIIYALVAPIQFNSWLRNRYINLHRLTGKLYFTAGFLNLITGCWLAWNSKQELGIFWPVMFVSVIYGFFLIQAYLAIIEKKIALHKYYVTISYMISFAIPMQRVVYFYLVSSNIQKIRQKIENANELFGRSFCISILSILIYSTVMAIRKYSHIHPKTI